MDGEAQQSFGRCGARSGGGRGKGTRPTLGGLCVRLGEPDYRNGSGVEGARRGHCFCRYADDCSISVRTQKAGERVMAPVTRLLEERLCLRVNQGKSAVPFVEERQFLGYRILRDGRLGIAPRSLTRVKRRIREITRRNRRVSLERMIRELNLYLTGWATYFRYAACKSRLKRLHEWRQRKLRCVRVKQRKRAKPIADFPQSLACQN